MSCNYADGLSAYENKGKLGLPEIFDEPEVVDLKVKKLSEWIKEARHTIVHTGAGISTASGIPDFRGPNGVWTLEEKGLKPNINISFDNAKPTLTHMSLLSLTESGYVKYIISQNIDGLHLRSGLKRSVLSELHGNMFISQCATCDKQFIRSQSVPTVGQKEINQNCLWKKTGGRLCRGKLHDNILDWEDNLPEKDLEMSILHSGLADLSIVLGSTLQIVPAGNLPLKAKKNPNGRLVIVNLQETKNNNKADLVIHSKVDSVMTQLLENLALKIPPYMDNLDPTKKLKELESRGIFRPLEWTIPLSSVSKLKKMISASKGQSEKINKPKSTRKRRRKYSESDDDDDDEDDFFFYNSIVNTSNKRIRNENHDDKEIIEIKDEIKDEEEEEEKDQIDQNYKKEEEEEEPLDLSCSTSSASSIFQHNHAQTPHSPPKIEEKEEIHENSN